MDGFELGKAPVVPCPDSPGTHGLITPDLSVGPVAIDALLAPDPALPAPEELSAIDVVDGCEDWFFNAWVLLQAGFAGCAKAMPDDAKANGSSAANTKRDIYSSFF